MAKKKKQVHLICNAHIDPVWLWEWEEGAAEAISTFRTAAELAENDKAFIFNHNEVTLYKWVQEYEPSLFKKIQKLVKEGKWHIMGGWYLQPDCNMPSGESFVRQILLGNNYFKKHFGVKPKTAINFDPFGHTQGLVQILAKSGYDSYLFGRPTAEWLDLKNHKFMWVGLDGSEIMATRFLGWYGTALGKAAEQIKERIEQNSEHDMFAILWGVGNHGGGPSKKDLRDINKLIEKTTDRQIIHSTPEKYFKLVKKDAPNLPRHKKDLNPWAVGCYTSQIRIKQKHRQLENELYTLEKMITTAWSQGLMEYPYEEMHEVVCDLLNAEFHDILPGSSIQSAEEAALRAMDHGLEIANRLRAQAFFALASGQKKAKEGQIPIFVYNHHPYEVTETVECEFNLADFRTKEIFCDVEVYRNGKLLDSQVEKEKSNIWLEWRKRIVFQTELEPGINRFDCAIRVLPEKQAIKLKDKNNRITVNNGELKVVINTKTGLVDKYAVNGVDYVKPSAFRPLVMKDDADSWGIHRLSLQNVKGSFKLMNQMQSARFSAVSKDRLKAVRVIEDGPTRTVVEALFVYNDSKICQKYKIPKHGTEMQLKTEVHWAEKDCMLKLSVPTTIKGAEYFGQVAYGSGKLPNDGTEAVAQKWTAVVSKKDNKALTCINNCIYGSDCKDGEMRLTLLRSPAYSAHPDNDAKMDMPQDRYLARIDQGPRYFEFWFNAGKTAKRMKAVDRESLVKNEKLFVLSFFPAGIGKKPKPFAILSDKTSQITAVKKAENSNNIIIRLFEPTGKATSTTLKLPALGKTIKVNLGAFEIKTLSINPKSKRYKEVDLLEK